jgi:hypothetical protein
MAIALCARLDCWGWATTAVAAFLRSVKTEIIFISKRTTPARAQPVEAGGLHPQGTTRQGMTLQVSLVPSRAAHRRSAVRAISKLDMSAVRPRPNAVRQSPDDCGGSQDDQATLAPGRIYRRVARRH